MILLYFSDFFIYCFYHVLLPYFLDFFIYCFYHLLSPCLFFLLSLYFWRFYFFYLSFSNFSSASPFSSSATICFPPRLTFSHTNSLSAILHYHYKISFWDCSYFPSFFPFYFSWIFFLAFSFAHILLFFMFFFCSVLFYLSHLSALFYPFLSLVLYFCVFLLFVPLTSLGGVSVCQNARLLCAFFPLQTHFKHQEGAGIIPVYPGLSCRWVSSLSIFSQVGGIVVALET